MKIALLSLAATAALATSAIAAAIPTASPSAYEPIRAEITNADPAHFTINVKLLANMFADDDAPIFAVYTSNTVPQTCGDFANTKLTYQKPDKYTRVFNLTNHPGILQAINEYKCVIIPNIPPSQ